MAQGMTSCTAVLLLWGFYCQGVLGGDGDGYQHEYKDYGSLGPSSFDPASNLFEAFYNFSCPRVSTIVADMVEEFLVKDPNLAGGLQRLHFHDCWVNGCDGSVLLASAPSSPLAEIDGFTNFKLRGIPEINAIKEAVEAECPQVVSCADILTLVARDATYKAGGPWWGVPLGRRDGFVSRAVDAETNLPFPNFSWDELVQNFAGKGFTAREMVVLSGSHTIGRAHCNAIAPQLYNFTGIDDLTNPALNETFAADLKGKCPKLNKDNVVDMDASNSTFDHLYYVALLKGEGVFTTDMALTTDAAGFELVTRFSQPNSTFFDEFARAMVKMGTIDVLIGAQGEVRKHCQSINR